MLPLRYVLHQKLRIGALGAARITQRGLLQPAGNIPEVEVVGIAARDRLRAEKYARKHRIPLVFDSYTALIEDRDIDAVYIPLPNSLHLEWAKRALLAGKHVLCEKPIACNADEAADIARVAKETGLVAAEAMHYLYHPLVFRLREILDSGVLGKLTRVEAACCIPLMKRDMRYDYALGGGALMDLGCYAVSLVRSVVDAEPEVVSAEAKLHSEKIDRWMRAELDFGDGCTAGVLCSMWSKDVLRAKAHIVGEHGSLTIKNPFAPQLFNEIVLETRGRKTSQRLKGYETSYYYQLKAFARAIQLGEPMHPGIDDAVATMRTIDAIYRKAGLPVRGAPVRVA